MITIEYYNSFHNSTARVRVSEDKIHQDGNGLQAQLSPSQQRRVQKCLCGMSDCCCGGHGNYWPPLGDSGWCLGGRIVD